MVEQSLQILHLLFTSSSSVIMFTGEDEESKPSTSSSSIQPCRHFRFPEILLATNNFDESLVIGQGGFGKVYKGNIIIGSSVALAAIKRLDSMSSQGAAEFWAEVEMLSKLRHCHLVSLFGYCNHEQEMILIYEYMPNGTLEDHLHKLGTPLSWLQRLKICIGAARGLDYLHTGTGIDVGVIHRDVKSSNILLHESWAAKISDFGLSKIGPTNQGSTCVNTLVKGTFGYLDHHYYSTGRLTRKSDVYAFGVVLLELLCRKRAVDKSLDHGLATWAQDSIKEGKVKDIIDYDIRGQISTKCLKDFVRIAGRCLLSHPKQRPTMAEVVFSLESVLNSQEKTNSSLQASGRTIFGRMLDIFPFSSNGENMAQDDSKPSSSGKDNITGNLKPRILAGAGSSGKVFLSRVDNNTFIPSSPDVAIKKHIEECFQRDAARLESAEVDFFTEYGEGSRYKLLEVIGKGSSSIVYSAIDTQLGEKVAIKKKKNIFEDLSDAVSILREIKLLRLLRHPDIVEIKNILLPPSRREFKDIYVVFELMESDLHQVIKENDDLTPKHHKFFLYQLLRGLKYIHTANVYHRDLKPKNILADVNCKLKICDFGLSRVVFNDQPTEINLTDYVASRWYMAPELCGSFSRRYTPAIDIWSVGCIFAEILTGKPLFPGKNVVHQLDLITDFLGTPSSETIARIRNEKARGYLSNMRRKNPVPFVRKFPKADPLALRLLERMISFEPKDRPTAEEALCDPYFKNMADVEREPSAQPIVKLEFEYERRKKTEEDMRKLIYREILEYHPNMLKEYLDEAQQAGFMNPRSFESFNKKFDHLEKHYDKGTAVDPLEKERSSSLSSVKLWNLIYPLTSLPLRELNMGSRYEIHNEGSDDREVEAMYDVKYRSRYLKKRHELERDEGYSFGRKID